MPYDILYLGYFPITRQMTPEGVNTSSQNGGAILHADIITINPYTTEAVKKDLKREAPLNIATGRVNMDIVGRATCQKARSNGESIC